MQILMENPLLSVKISCVTDLNQVTRLLANLCREGSQHQDVRPKPEKQRPDTDSSEGDEELDQYEIARVARRKGKIRIEEKAVYTQTWMNSLILNRKLAEPH